MKKVLILAYYYPPIGGAGVQRVSKFIKYLPEYGFSPVVVAGTGTDNSKQFLEDKTLEANVEHLSGGKADANFYLMAEKFCRKWKNIPTAPDIIETTCGVFNIKKGIISNLMYLLVVLRRKICSRRFQRQNIKRSRMCGSF